MEKSDYVQNNLNNQTNYVVFSLWKLRWQINEKAWPSKLEENKKISKIDEFHEASILGKLLENIHCVEQGCVMR